jgi:VWFA-related protein
MPSVRHWCVAALVLAAGLSGSARSKPERAYVRPERTQQAPALHAQLDRYLHGEFDAVVSEVAARGKYDDLLDDLKRHGPAWIDAEGPAGRSRRALAAATFALETTRAAEDEDWKWIQRINLGSSPGFPRPSYQPEPALWWKTPPRLLEWGCATIRDIGTPTPVERIWHLAALSVAERRSDFEFLLGSPWELRENPKDEIEHLNHASFRFPDEPRIALAQSIAMEWRTWPLTARHPRTAVLNATDAMRGFERQLNDPLIGAEAALRLGALRLRGRNVTGAIELFDRVERQTRDRYLIYLARYFGGQARERQSKPADAEKSYRGALATIPKAISATMALAAVLTRDGRMTEASTIAEAALTANPPPVDPWRTYAAADDRFWPVLITRLQAEIRTTGSGPSKPEGPYDGQSGPYEEDGEDDEVQQQPPPPPPQQPVFRSRTDVVTIDVSVRSQGTPAAGLTAKDFVLLDNGVPQTVEQIDMEAVPVDVSILLDLNEDLADDLGGMSNQIPRIVAMLRPTDRVRVTAINTHVTDLIRAQTAAEVPALRGLKPQGLSSAFDGIAAALLRHVDPNRRHLVIALTNGIDAISALDAKAVSDIARYSNATLYIALADIVILPGPPPEYQSGRQRLDAARCAASGVCSPSKRFWQPYGDYEFPILSEAADITGGKLYLPGIFTDRTAAAIFKKVFEDYRASYVLRYVPKGAPTTGWHEVKVTIPGQPSFDVQARRGYFVEAPGRSGGAPASAATAAATPAERLGTTAPGRVALADLARAYGAGDFSGFIGALQQVVNRAELVRELRASGNPWPDHPNRESAFVLELVDFALQSPRREDREEGRKLLLAHRPLVRGPFGPEAYERYWLWAAIAVLEGANQPDLAQQLIADGLKQFPDEPRFRLARAFVTDQSRALNQLARNGTPLPTAASHIKDVTAAYDNAMNDPETAVEARVRKSWLLHRAARGEEALAVLDSIGTPPEALLDYLRHLIRGRVLDGLGRTDEAASAFRSAVLLFPNAQSARVGLMTALQRQGNNPGALEQAEFIQTIRADAIDPWWRYWQGDYRLLGTVFTRLREQGR